jgi:hypothetical protein
LHRILLFKTTNQKTKKIKIMKASIIYTVAVSVVLISTLEIRLDKNNFGKIGTRRAAKINPSLKQNENQKATVDFTKIKLVKTNFEVKKESPIVLVKPELVLEASPVVYTLVPTTERSWSFESAIIEENDSEETQTLDYNESNTVSNKEEVIEVAVVAKKETSFNDKVRQENAIIEEPEESESKTLDFNWINTLAMYDEAIVSSSSTKESNSVDFSVVGEDSSLSEQPLDFNWIETLQMFDEPIVSPQQNVTEKNLIITEYLNNSIIESNQ